MHMKKFIFILIHSIITLSAKAQSVSFQQAQSYADSGNYIEAIKLMKIVAERERNTEYYMDDIAAIARYYSHTNELDSLIQYNNLTLQLAEKLLESNDSIAEIYIQSAAWNYEEGGLYESFVNTAKRVLELRDNIYQPFSKESFRWIEIINLKAFEHRDLLRMIQYCDEEINRAEKFYGITSPIFEKAISSIRLYAHILVEDTPELIINWIKPYYDKIRNADVWPREQYEFEIILLSGFLDLNDLKSAYQYSIELEKWIHDSCKYYVSLDDKVRIMLNLAIYEFNVGNSIKSRWMVDKSWQLLKEANVTPSIDQLINRLGIERGLRFDPNGRFRINAEWIIDTTTPIIELGKEDAEILAYFYDSRSWAYMGIHKYDKAISDMESAIALKPMDIRKMKLAQIYLSKGNYEIAEKLYLEVYNNPNTSSSMKNNAIMDLTALYWAWGRKKELEKFLPIDFNIQKSNIRKAFAFMNEYERENFLEEKSFLGDTNYFDIYTSFSSNKVQWEFGNRMAYNLALIQKGLLLSTAKGIDDILNNAPDSIKKINQLYKQAQHEINIPGYENNYIRKLKDTVMKYVSDQSDFLNHLNITWKNVRENLSYGEAAIEFINLLGMLPNNMTDYNPSIGALILHKDFSAPIFIYLTDVASIDSLYEYGDNGERFDDVIYSGNAKVRLYKKIWEPLEPYLKNIQTIYYSPTGILQTINIDCIGKDEAELLSDRYELYRLSSTREICNKKTKEQFKEAILYGDISYSINTHVINEKPISKFRSTSRSGFNSLNGTAIEIDSIKLEFSLHGLKNKTLTKEAATDDSFRQVSKSVPSILHIATHGFYYTNDQIAQKLEDTCFITFQIGKSELYRSGLALSGAQDSWSVNDLQKYQALDSNNDGILLSAEIAQMNLSGLDLVVLSACETALGKIKPEGVYGIQRAFKLAGVKSIMMSLWKVDDYATQILMTSFYRNYLNGMSMREALHTSQKALRETPGFENPYYWAAFILLDALK